MHVADVAGLTETPLPISTTSVYHNIHNINKLDIDSSAILSSMVTETSTSTTTSTADFTKTSGTSGNNEYCYILLDSHVHLIMDHTAYSIDMQDFIINY